ncbi:MAG: FliO/MopB family protein [bacterium]|nr:FliO/MopB family protein [bacterium]
MDFVFGDYARFALSLAFVLGLILVLGWALKRLGAFSLQKKFQRKGPASLGVMSSCALDNRRRMVVVQWEDQEHLILLSPTAETIVSTRTRDQGETCLNQPMPSKDTLRALR